MATLEKIVIPHPLRTGEVLGLTLGFGISTLAVSIRLYTKAFLARSLKVEDYLSVLAWVSFIPYVSLAVVIGRNGGDPIYSGYLAYIGSITYCSVIVIIKLSILLQYISIFMPHRQGLAYNTTHVLIWINVIYFTIHSFTYIFGCNPREKNWTPSLHGHCIGIDELGISSGTVNVVSDFAMFILPLPIIRRLQMSTGKKARVYGCFWFGFVACICSVVRLVYSVRLLRISKGSPDYRLTVDGMGLWSFAEMSIGIIVGCLPSLPRFFKQVFARRNPFSSSAQVASNTRSGWSYWRELWRKSKTAHTDTEQGQAPPRRVFGSDRVQSKAPCLPTINFSHSSIHLFDMHIPKRPPPMSSEGVSVQQSRQWQAPASWLLGVEEGADLARRDTESTQRTLC